MHSDKDHDWENLEWNGTQEDRDPARYDLWWALVLVAILALLWWVLR